MFFFPAVLLYHKNDYKYIAIFIKEWSNKQREQQESITDEGTEQWQHEQQQKKVFYYWEKVFKVNLNNGEPCRGIFF